MGRQVAPSAERRTLEVRPAIHSDFIWIIQIFFLKFSEIQITWLKIQIFFGLNLVEISI